MSWITRKTNEVGDEQRLLLFSKRPKNKLKLQKYKEEYRQFLKTQMFERAKNMV